jgi:hypothetical protein
MITQSARMLKLLWQSILDTRLIEQNLLRLKYMPVSLKNALALIFEVTSFNVQTKNIRI